MYDAILKHLEDPACSHLKPLIYDIVSTMQNLENELKNRMAYTYQANTTPTPAPVVYRDTVTVALAPAEEHHTLVPPLGKPSPV
jgi:hypothetical protein